VSVIESICVFVCLLSSFKAGSLLCPVFRVFLTLCLIFIPWFTLLCLDCAPVQLKRPITIGSMTPIQPLQQPGRRTIHIRPPSPAIPAYSPKITCYPLPHPRGHSDRGDSPTPLVPPLVHLSERAWYPLALPHPGSGVVPRCRCCM
jgi:hypothetical protein